MAWFWVKVLNICYLIAIGGVVLPKKAWQLSVNQIIHQFFAGILILTFMVSDVSVYAQGVVQLSAPGTLLALSPSFTPPLLKGLKVYPDNPFRFDFILDKGDAASTDEQLKTDSTRLIKYFLASLTVPEKDLWVNLSPYEKDRIVPEAFGQTEMGRDLLAQDYILKQITASVIYPEGEIGKRFWKKIYALAQEKYGTTDIPIDTFNKVWVLPAKAVVYENGKSGVVYIMESRLKVMLESDYLAAEKNASFTVADSGRSGDGKQDIAKDVLRAVVIPELEREVNEGKNFAQLRQVYQSLILAAWYKKKVKDSLLSQVYVDRNKTTGVNIQDPKEMEKIWERYVEAFKNGVYNYVKEEQNKFSQEFIPRKYFSGGFGFTGADLFPVLQVNDVDKAQGINKLFQAIKDSLSIVEVQLDSLEAERIVEEPAVERHRWLKSEDIAQFRVEKLIQRVEEVMPSPDAKNRQDWFEYNVLVQELKLRPGVTVHELAGAQMTSSGLDIDSRLQYLSKFKLLLNELGASSHEKGFLGYTLENIMQHVSNGIGLYVRVLDGPVRRIYCIDNGGGFVNRKDGSRVFIREAIKPGRSFGSGGNKGLGLARAFEDVQLFRISQPAEEAIGQSNYKGEVEILSEVKMPGKTYGVTIEGIYYAGRDLAEWKESMRDALIAKSVERGSGQEMKTGERSMVVKDNLAEKAGDEVQSVVSGGIDLSRSDMNLQAHNAGEGINFHIDPAIIQQFQNVSGFVPVIINIQPIQDLRLFFGPVG